MDFLNKRFQELYEVNGTVTVDESMIKFKGRLSFRQYMKMKVGLLLTIFIVSV